VAEEDSCFFDIMLPNYTNNSDRKITYFNEITDELDQEKNKQKADTILEYYTTLPFLPVGMDIAEMDYRGEISESSKLYF